MVIPATFDAKEIDQEPEHMEQTPWPLAQKYLEKCTIYHQLSMNLSCSKGYSLPPKSVKLTSNVHCLYLQLLDSISKLLGSCDPQVFVESCANLMASDIHRISLFSTEFLDDLSECHTTTEMVRHLLVYSTWCDYSLVEKLVEVYNYTKGFELLKSFRNQITFVEDYSFPIPCNLMVPSSSSAYTIMTTQCVSFQSINVVKSLITIQFEITDLSCLLLAATNEPVILYWLIPKTVVSHIATKIHQISQFLWNEGISEVAVYHNFACATSSSIIYGSSGSLGFLILDVSFVQCIQKQSICVTPKNQGELVAEKWLQ